MNIKKIIGFFRHDMWHIKRDEVSPLAFFAVGVLKKLYISIEFFTTRRVIDMASALTYSTLLAIVPIFAVVFAIARGFGYNKYIELWFRGSLSSQPQAADTIIAFVNSYLVHTKSGVFFGVGLVFMLFTVLMLAGQANDYIVLGSVMRVTVDVLPYVLMSVVFMGLYLFMPNTKVRFSVVVIPGILAGIAMQVLQLFYIHAQIFLSSYNAIYGSFAALPLFMLWVQISWTICLFGVELCYTNQNMDELSFMTYTSKISHRYKLLLSVTLMSHICHRFAEGRKPYTALDLKMMTDIPIRITQDLLYNLVSVGLLSENSAEGKDAEPTYQPALSLEHITIGSIVERLDSLGEWHLDIDVRKQLENVSWREYMRERKAYLDNLRKIGIV